MQKESIPEFLDSLLANQSNLLTAYQIINDRLDSDIALISNGKEI